MTKTEKRWACKRSDGSYHVYAPRTSEAIAALNAERRGGECVRLQIKEVK